MSDQQFTIVRHNPTRWFAWRDLVSILLGLTVLLLVVQVGQLRHELDRRPTAEQFEVLTHQLEVKDARIKQLTDTLVRNRIPVPPEPVVSPVPSPTPGLTPSPPVPSPHPPAGRSSSPRPRPTHKPTASPHPTCLVFVAGTCLTPPPVPLRPFA